MCIFNNMIRNFTVGKHFPDTMLITSVVILQQQRKKCPRLVVTFRHQPGSSSVLNSSFHPSTSGPPYRATTLPLRTTKYNVPPGRLCPTSGPQFDVFSTRTLFAEKVSSHLGILKHGRKTDSKSFDMSWV